MAPDSPLPQPTGTFIDTDGVEYQLHGDPNAVGVTMLFRDMRLAIKCPVADHTTLKELFGDMVEDIDDKTVYLVQSKDNSSPMALFIGAMAEQKLYPKDWSSAQMALNAFKLLAPQPPPEPQKKILNAALDVLQPMNLFDAFVVASELNDVLAGAKILCRGDTAEQDPNVTKLRPMADGSWTKVQADKVNSRWIWALNVALCQAGDFCHHEEYDTASPVDKAFWCIVSGCFIDKLSI